MSGAAVVALLVGLAIFSLFMSIRQLMPGKDPVEERLREYGLTDYIRSGGRRQEERPERFRLLERLAQGFGLAEKWRAMLLRANVPLTVGEFTALLLGLCAVGFMIGALRGGPPVGAMIAGVFCFIPFFYMKQRQAKRKQAFAAQLPDVLTLLVGSLRAGYGMSQALELLAREVPEPAATEFQRVIRSMSLGLPLQKALQLMAERVESDDFDLVVTAITVQYEMGGNLSTILENISSTIRERVRVLREVQVLTAQQRMTGNVLAGLPIFLAVALSFISPGYFNPFFEPGWPRVLPLIAGGMIAIGFLIIRKIVDIKV
ncbi:MAG: type II secretion system F family protein [Caldilinea sp.]|nr:type II secretion system F family protein [Caldilinea sp.]MDW8442109.1 type II secretion system F family protein [Caldilineaceae bacterium]